MRLVSPQMTDGVDAECRIEHCERATDAGEEKAPDSPHDAVIQKPDHKRPSEPTEYQDRVVPVLPDGNRVNCHARGIFRISVEVRGQKPPAVTMPKAQLCIIGVFLIVAVYMVADMISSPLNGGILQCPGSGD